MRQADQQARPSDMTGFDGIAQTGIGTPCVAHRGNPQLQGPPQLRHRLQQPVRGRAAGVFQAGESHMSVAVDQARKKRQAGAVDALIAVETRRDVRDAPVLDGDVSRADRAASRVEDSSAVQQRSHAGSIPPLPGVLNPMGLAWTTGMASQSACRTRRLCSKARQGKHPTRLSADQVGRGVQSDRPHRFCPCGPRPAEPHVA